MAAEPILIDLDQPKRGYRRFISAWLHRLGDRTAVVDPGPTSTIDHLCGELARLGVTRLDWILLTHIHLDHGGGAGTLARRFPEARVVCLPAAARHLVDPTRLWEGSLQVLGDNAPLFGRPEPVPADRIDDPAVLEPLGVRTLPTPGHAAHHVCFLHGDLIFAGEAAGMTCPTSDGGFCLRPATPPRFLRDVAVDSLDRLLALDPAPRRAAFGHYGLHAEPALLFRAARGQLHLWTEILAELTAPGARRVDDALRPRLLETLQARDPWFAPFARLDDDLRARELEFLANTWRGMSGWLEDRDAEG
ncbi:MBL fold metallo-hydrolase [bacterium]|nr:MBL fold metallo-hydrolase [bacterium]